MINGLMLVFILIDKWKLLMKLATPSVILFFCVIGAVQFGCTRAECQNSMQTFRLNNRQIKVVGIDPFSGRMNTVPLYKRGDTYKVLAKVIDLNITEPGSSGLSGSINSLLLVENAPENSGYKKGDQLRVVGGLDGTIAWLKKGKKVFMIFLVESKKFVDLRPTEVN